MPTPVAAIRYRLASRHGAARVAMGFAAVLMAAGGQARAGSVYLNGMNIDGVTSQRFEGCTVLIDDKGNVHITAKGYEVQTLPVAKASPVAAQAPPVTKRYFLVFQSNAPADVQYEIDVFLNETWVKRVTGKDTPGYLEVTRFLRQGKNRVHIVASKKIEDATRPPSPNSQLHVLMGEGTVNAKEVVLDGALVDYTRSAAETQAFANDFEITGR